MFHRYRTHDEDSSKIVDVPQVQVVDKIMDVPVTKQRQCLAVKKKASETLEVLDVWFGDTSDAILANPASWFCEFIDNVGKRVNKRQLCLLLRHLYMF